MEQVKEIGTSTLLLDRENEEELRQEEEVEEVELPEKPNEEATVVAEAESGEVEPLQETATSESDQRGEPEELVSVARGTDEILAMDQTPLAPQGRKARSVPSTEKPKVTVPRPFNFARDEDVQRRTTRIGEVRRPQADALKIFNHSVTTSVTMGLPLLTRFILLAHRNHMLRNSLIYSVRPVKPARSSSLLTAERSSDLGVTGRKDPTDNGRLRKKQEVFLQLFASLHSSRQNSCSPGKFS